MKSYRYKKNRSTPTGVSAQDVGREIDRILTARGGEDLPQSVVDESRPRDALLHPQFEWKDKVAAEEYRKHQARNIINVIDVVHTDSVSTQAFVNVIDEVVSEAMSDVEPPEKVSQRSYQTIESVMNNPAQRMAYVRSVWNRLLALKEQYKGVAELAAVWDAIDDAGESLAG